MFIWYQGSNTCWLISHSLCASSKNYVQIQLICSDFQTLMIPGIALGTAPCRVHNFNIWRNPMIYRLQCPGIVTKPWLGNHCLERGLAKSQLRNVYTEPICNPVTVGCCTISSPGNRSMTSFFMVLTCISIRLPCVNYASGLNPLTPGWEDGMHLLGGRVC